MTQKGLLEIIPAGFAKKVNTNVHCIAIIVRGGVQCLTISEPTALICFRIRDDNTRMLPLSCVFGIKPGTGVRETVMLYNGNNMMINNTDIRTETLICHILVLFTNYRDNPIKGTGAVML